MKNKQCIAAMNSELRYAMRTYHAGSGMLQAEPVDMMYITRRACSGLENRKYSSTVFFIIALLSIL